MAETAQAALTAGRFPSKDLGPAAFWERQHLGMRGAIGPTPARSHLFTQRACTTCRLIGTVLPTEEEASPAGFLPAQSL